MRHKQDLLAHLNNKERAAIEVTFKQYYTLLKAMAYGSVKDEAEAEDIIIKVFHKLVTTQRVFNSMDEVKGYLFLAVKNHCINYWQKKQRQENLLAKVPLLPQPDAQEPNAINNLDYQDLSRLVKAKLQSLPKQCREVAELILFGNKERSEIADALNITTNHVNALYSRACKHLRSALTTSADFDIPAIFILLAILAMLSFH
jgi:RNA polymerase sigma-70 factor (ECF subfamily)